MAKRKFEILLVIEGTERQAHAAANAAWYAANNPHGPTDERRHLVDEIARERLPDGTTCEVGWADWSEATDLSLAVGYLDPDRRSPGAPGERALD